MSLTWPQVLQDKLSDTTSEMFFTVRYFPGCSAKIIADSFEKDAFYFHFQQKDSQPNIVIFAFGVVDAAPRPITYSLKRLAGIPKIGPKLWRSLNYMLKPWKTLILRIGHYHLTSTSSFERLIGKLIDNSAGVSKFYLLDTPLPHVFLESRTPGFREDVMKYNQIKQSLGAKFDNVDAVSLSEFSEDFYISKEDGHHFSNKGHEYVALTCLKFLTDDLKEFEGSY